MYRKDSACKLTSGLLCTTHHSTARRTPTHAPTPGHRPETGRRADSESSLFKMKMTTTAPAATATSTSTSPTTTTTTTAETGAPTVTRTTMTRPQDSNRSAAVVLSIILLVGICHIQRVAGFATAVTRSSTAFAVSSSYRPHHRHLELQQPPAPFSLSCPDRSTSCGPDGTTLHMAAKDADMTEEERDEAIGKATKAMTFFTNSYLKNTGTKLCSDKSIPAVVIKGLAEHKVSLGAPLCPCRFYEDKEAEAKDGFWNCPCVPMRERHECHCMLFLTEDNSFVGEESVSAHSYAKLCIVCMYQDWFQCCFCCFGCYCLCCCCCCHLCCCCYCTQAIKIETIELC